MAKRSQTLLDMWANPGNPAKQARNDESPGKAETEKSSLVLKNRPQAQQYNPDVPVSADLRFPRGDAYDFGSIFDKLNDPGERSKMQPCNLLQLFDSHVDLKLEEYEHLPSTEKKDSRLQSGSYQRRFRPQHASKFPWVAYSHKYKGLFCRACVLFGSAFSGALVTKPLCQFDKLTGDSKRREGLDYHDASPEHILVVNTKIPAARLAASNPERSVAGQLNAEFSKQQSKNRALLRPVIDVIRHCIVNGIPLRGHRDDNESTLSTESCGKGNFKETLALVARFHPDLASHIANGPKNAKYDSKTTQNELINICADLVIKEIVAEVKKATYFSIIADETADISQQEQLAVVLRYYNEERGQILEELIGLQVAEDLTGQGLAVQIIDMAVDSLGLDRNYLVGQGYDGAAAMAGEHNGVQSVIRRMEGCELAIYVHCAAHTLNLVLADGAKDPLIRNAIGSIKATINFFKDSPKRFRILKSEIEKLDTKRRRLLSFCETRWVERHDCIMCFRELLDAILASLTTISTWPAKENGTLASQLLHQLSNDVFVISMVILHKTLAVTKGLSETLQKKDYDLVQCIELVKHARSVLQGFRDDPEVFNRWFKEAEELLGNDIHKPRVVGRQTMRANIDVQDAREYFRISCFYSYIDTVLSQLDVRFLGHQQHALCISSLLPSRCCSVTFEDIRPAVTFYERYLDRPYEVELEFGLWQSKWSTYSKTAPPPSAVTEALAYCSNQPALTNIRKLLLIFAAIPVTSASSERAFSQLRLIKTYLRANMTEDRLSSLLIGRIHRERVMRINLESIIDVFSEKNRRLDFSC